jgi:hypothetical protein
MEAFTSYCRTYKTRENELFLKGEKRGRGGGRGEREGREREGRGGERRIEGEGEIREGKSR